MMEIQLTFDEMMQEVRNQENTWKTDYAVTRIVFMVAKFNRRNAISGSPEWVLWSGIESVADELLGIILDGRP